jgi:hypothetical protein
MNAPLPWKSRLLHFGIRRTPTGGVVHNIRARLGPCVIRGMGPRDHSTRTYQASNLYKREQANRLATDYLLTSRLAEDRTDCGSLERTPRERRHKTYFVITRIIFLSRVNEFSVVFGKTS